MSPVKMRRWATPPAKTAPAKKKAPVILEIIDEDDDEMEIVEGEPEIVEGEPEYSAWLKEEGCEEIAYHYHGLPRMGSVFGDSGESSVYSETDSNESGEDEEMDGAN